jgi:hypothetical protein
MVGRQFVALKVVGSSPTTYPLGKVTFFQKNKIKKRIFKKKHHLISLVLYQGVQKIIIFKNILFNGYCLDKLNSRKTTNKTIVGCFLTQKFNNPKSVVYVNKNLNTFSVGSVIKYFKVKQSKCLRRSVRGLKVFLNFLRNVFQKKYTIVKPRYFVYSVSGFDYSLLTSRKNVKQFFQNTNHYIDIYMLYNLKISFTNQKSKKIKSIKKRLKKKILQNFLKKTNI